MKQLFMLVVAIGMPLSAHAADTRHMSQKVDAIVNDFLKKEGVRKGASVNDEIYVRRVYLDIAGRIPTLEEYSAFMSSSDRDKRSKLVDALLDSPGFVSQSHNHWRDALRIIKSVNKGYLTSYDVWVRNAIIKNMPYDEFVKAMISSEGASHNPETGAAGYYLRDHEMLPDSISNTMQLFLGTSMVCAQCHDHPFNDYTQMDYLKLQAFLEGTVTVAGNKVLELDEALLAEKKLLEEMGYKVGNKNSVVGGKKAGKSAYSGMSGASGMTGKSGMSMMKSDSAQAAMNAKPTNAKPTNAKSMNAKSMNAKSNGKKSKKSRKSRRAAKHSKQKQTDNLIASVVKDAHAQMPGKRFFKKGGYSAVYGWYDILGEGAWFKGSGQIKLPHDYKYDDGKPGEYVRADVPFAPSVSIDFNKRRPQPDIDLKVVAKRTATARSGRGTLIHDVNGREYLANWITSPENPMFAKTAINRMWHRVFGAPLVGELLDIDLDDFGQSKALTTYLIDVVKKLDYDQKAFMGMLFKTDLYQREAVNLDQMTYQLQGPVLQRLSAEQLWDSLLTIRSSDPDRFVIDGLYSEKNVMYLEMTSRDKAERMAFAILPVRHGDKASKKLAQKMVPKVRSRNQAYYSARASALFMEVPQYLPLFGQSTRMVVDASVKDANILQAVYQMNDTELLKLQKESPLAKRLASLSSRSHSNKATSLIYNAVLSRVPTTRESQALSHLSHEDRLWVLINSSEFKMKR